MSDSVWPQRRQPTRLPHPWDSPGKNTGVGCHFLLQCMKVKVHMMLNNAKVYVCVCTYMCIWWIFQNYLEWSKIILLYTLIRTELLITYPYFKLSKLTELIHFSECSAQLLRHVQLFFNPLDCSPSGTSVHGILQQGYWNGLTFSPPGDLPNPGIKPVSSVPPALAGEFFTTAPPEKPNSQ